MRNMDTSSLCRGGNVWSQAQSVRLQALKGAVYFKKASSHILIDSLIAGDVTALKHHVTTVNMDTTTLKKWDMLSAAQ